MNQWWDFDVLQDFESPKKFKYSLFYDCKHTSLLLGRGGTMTIFSPTMSQSVTESVNHKAVYRTAPVTPGLLNMTTKFAQGPSPSYELEKGLCIRP